jgi:class 3 adenylate cyclase/predicted ATPase
VDFYQVVDQVIELLRHRSRVSYRALQRQFGLDDAYLEDLKAELIVAQRLAVDEHGQVLVWTEGATSTMPLQAVSASPSDTPLRLEAEHGDSGGIRLYGALHLALVFLQHEGRLTYRTLMQLCGLDQALMEAVRDELLFKRVARDEHGQGLVWRDEASAVRVSSLVTMGAADRLETPAVEIQLPAIVPPHDLTTAMDSAPTATPLSGAATADGSYPPTSPDASGTASEAVRRAREAERRQLTVLFCDLVGSTMLSGQLDPEDLRAVVRAYQETAAVLIQRYEGHIAQYLGDGLLVYFGYPQAHEDDAQRAVHTGVELVEAIGGLNTRLEARYGVQLAVRLGIHTGPVVVGDIGGGGRHEQLALGETPNIAARLEGLAAPNTVVISPVTARLVRQTFALEDLGASALKGVTEPMVVSRVLGLRTPSRHDDEAPPNRTPFLVGRDEELGLLRRRWDQSKEGLGQVVLLSGAAGLGKSALVTALRAQVGREGYARLTLRCSPYYTNSALYPVIEYLQQVLQFERTDPPETKLAKLEQEILTCRLPCEEIVPLFGTLLAVPLPAERYALRSMSPQQQRQQTQDALVAWLLEKAARQPVLAVWEDLHWADPTTRELLGLLVEQTPTAAMLHVLTFRPEFAPPWPTRSHLTPITLNRLERSQVEALIAHLAGGKVLPAGVVAHIVARTDGVPLYVEELTKMLLASDLLRAEATHYVLTGPLSTMAIPETLQDSLMARLDQLPTAKEVAQLGAVLGREFPYDMLRAISSQDEATVQDGLIRLVAAELLYQRGRPPRARYRFKHALIQDAAYASLLRSTRQQVHQQVAQLLEARSPEVVETQPELVAQHYTAAGCAEQAVHYWQRAGQQASDRSAHLEAISHFTTGIELLKSLPETPARTQHAVTLYIALGAALQVTKGHAALEVEHAYTQARALCQQVGETPELVPVLFGLWRFYVTLLQLHTARELGETLLRLAQHADDQALMVIAHYALGWTWLCLGVLPAARQHLEAGIARYTPDQRRAPVFRMGQDPGVGCRAFAALILWSLGYPEQALAHIHDALALAHALADPFSLAWARCYAAFVSQFRRDVPAVHEHAEAAVALSTAQGFPQWMAMGTSLRGWALAMQSQGEVGMAQVRQGITAWQATGAKFFVPYFCTLLAEVSDHLGHPEEGLQALAEAHTLVQQHEDRYWEAEVCRLRGVLLLRQPGTPQAEAETWLQRALDVTRHQEAKSLELRAAMSLSRLWQQQGKRQEAHDLLAPVYAWFTEGFDTADLQDAKAFLDTLA